MEVNMVVGVETHVCCVSSIGDEAGVRERSKVKKYVGHEDDWDHYGLSGDSLCGKDER